MVKTRVRQAKAGPSRCVKPRSKGDSIIELTDSEDDKSDDPRPLKRRRTVSVRTIDLTLSSPAADKSVIIAEDALEKGKEKALADVANALEILHTQQPLVLVDPPDIDETAKGNSGESEDHYLSQILEVVPEVQPEYVRSLLAQYQPTYGTDVVTAVLHELFEHSYPRIERNKGKRKHEGNDSVEEPGSTLSKDYGTRDRPFEGGEHYRDIAMTQLTIDFPRIPVPYIRETLRVNNWLYAPTHVLLRDQLTWDPAPFTLKKMPTRPSGKGKQHDPEFEREYAWLVQLLRNKAAKGDASSQEADESDGECEDGIECGCCFSKYLFDKMAQCPDAHLFCKGCMTSYAGNLLGQQDPDIVCMDQSGCKLYFAEAELRRILSPKMIELYERVKQTKEIEAAGLDGLEECPFCDYKVVIENPDEKLFHCQHEECGAITCRACKKADHLPKSCKEAEEDRGVNVRRKVEEAMTEALMRNCPKCKKGFIKEGGCNKMTCPNCRTLSCYICRQIISGYDHFDSRPSGQKDVGPSSSSGQKCLLWDPIEKRHDQEVAAAREKAIKEAKNLDPGVDAKQLEVELRTNVPEANDVRVGQARQRRHNLPQGLIFPRLRANGVVPEGHQGVRAAALPRLGCIHGYPFNPAPLPPGANLEQMLEMHRVMTQRMNEINALRERQRAEAQRRNEDARRELAERQEHVRRQFEALQQRRREILERQQQRANQMQEAERQNLVLADQAALMVPGQGQGLGRAPEHFHFAAPNPVQAPPLLVAHPQGPHLPHPGFPFLQVPPPQFVFPEIAPGMAPGMQRLVPPAPGGAGPVVSIPPGSMHPLPPVAAPQQPIPPVFHFPGVIRHYPGNAQLPGPLHVRRDGQ